MNKEKIESLLLKIKELEDEIDEELEKGKNKLECDFHKEKISILRYIAEAKLLHIITAPVIYSMIIPAVIMDIFVSVYQFICFPVYKIALVKRGDYIIIDRYKLPYLNMIQKINCIYCGYFNGLIAYTMEIASRTEQYWCPIRHSKRAKLTHSRYFKFLNYGDGRDLSKRWDKLREELAKK